MNELLENNNMNKSSYVIRHWRGELTLAKSYWVNNILLTFIFIFLSGMLYSLFNAYIDFESSYRLVSILFILFYGIAIVLTLWQLVGLWRSATNYSLKSNKPWGTIAKIAVILGTITNYHSISQTILPQLAEFWKIFTINYEHAPYKLRVLRDASELELTGELEFGVYSDVKKYLNAHPTIRIIHLNSIGGRMMEAIKLASLIKKRKLVTYTSTFCHSACIFPFAAGKERLISKTARLGFHRAYFPGIQDDILSSEFSKSKEFLISQGIAESFINKIYAIPHNELWTPSHEELIQANFISGHPKLNQVGISGINPSDLNSIIVELEKNPFILTIKERIPQAYEYIINAVTSGIQHGRSMSEIRSLTIPLISKICLQYLPYASDEILIKYVELSIERLNKLRSINPELCYNFILGNNVNIDFTQFLSDELIKEEMTLGSEIIKTYSKERIIVTEEEARADIMIIITNLREMYGQDVQLLQKATHFPKERPKYCNLEISFLQRVLELPQSKSASLLRFIFASN